MESDLSEAARLIQEALSGPETVTELRTQSGRPVRVERDPEPGIQLRLTLTGTDGDGGDWIVYLVEPGEQRPRSYPSTAPFVPGVAAIVAIFGGTLSITWRPAEGAVCPAPELEPDEKLVRLSEQLRSVRETATGGDPELRRSIGQRVKALFDALDPGTRGKLEEFLQHLSPNAETIEQLEQIFEDVLEASLADGWSLVSRKDSEKPARSMGAHLERDKKTRSIMMMTLSRSVMMTESPRKAETLG